MAQHLNQKNVNETVKGQDLDELRRPYPRGSLTPGDLVSNGIEFIGQLFKITGRTLANNSTGLSQVVLLGSSVGGAILLYNKRNEEIEKEKEKEVHANA